MTPFSEGASRSEGVVLVSPPPRSLRSRTPSDGEGKEHDPLFRGGIAQRGGGINQPPTLLVQPLVVFCPPVNPSSLSPWLTHPAKGGLAPRQPYGRWGRVG